MKNWNTLTPDTQLILTKNYTPGRGGKQIKYIVLHHNAANLTTQDCYNTWQTRPASAHYQVEQTGIIGQLVHDQDTAWHAGNYNTNQVSIGIEHANDTLNPTWTISPQTLDNGAHLVAALCTKYNLGTPTWGTNVFPHQTFTSTACPGAIATTQRDTYMTHATYWYNVINNQPTNGVEAVATVASGLVVDGLWGYSTTRALQACLGTPVDGVVSSQPAVWRGANPGLTGGWEWFDNPQGSQMIAVLQQRLGVSVDGLVGPETFKALQKRLGTTVDGVISDASQCVMRLQELLNAGKGI